MGVFVRLIPDSNIIKSAEDFSSVAIVGCGGCANFSLALEKDIPLSQITTDEKTGKPKRLPHAMREEVMRLKKLLEDKGMNVIGETMTGMCGLLNDELSEMFSNTKFNKVDERCANVEAVISLCCSGGVFGLRQRLGKDIRIVPGMRDAGTWQAFQILDEEKKFILVDRDRSTVIRWKQASQAPSWGAIQIPRRK